MFRKPENQTLSTSITGNGTLGNLALVVTIVVAAIGWGNSTLLPMSERISFIQRELERNNEVDNRSIEDRQGVHASLATIETNLPRLRRNLRIWMSVLNAWRIWAGAILKRWKENYPTG